MWRCWYPSEDDLNSHVVPEFGPEHELSKDCWCYPEPDPDEPRVLVHHEMH